MIIGQDNFDFHQVGLMFFVVALLFCIREKRITPYLLAIFGTLVHGWASTFFILGLLLIDRLHTQRTKWLILLNAIGFAALMGASVLEDAYRPIFLLFSLPVLSIHFRQGGLGVLVPLVLVHQFFPADAPVEIVLSAAGFYFIFEEVLRLLKVKNLEQVMVWIEVPVVLAIFYPFRDELMKLFEDPSAGAVLVGAWVIFGVIAGVLFGKKAQFQSMVRIVYTRGARFYKSLNRGFSERQKWIQELKPTVVAVDSGFGVFFWVVMVILALWVALIAMLPMWGLS